jgi:hypothetical protein
MLNHKLGTMSYGINILKITKKRKKKLAELPKDSLTPMLCSMTTTISGEPSTLELKARQGNPEWSNQSRSAKKLKATPQSAR